MEECVLDEIISLQQIGNITVAPRSSNAELLNVLESFTYKHDPARNGTRRQGRMVVKSDQDSTI